MAYIELKDVCVNYGNEDVLHHLHLSIDKGEMTAIIGKSGCGKTTLLQVIGGLLECSQGEVIIDHQDIRQLHSNKRVIYLRKRIAYIFQDYRLIEEMTVLENIQLPFLIKKEKYDQDYLDDLLQTMGLTHKKHAYPHELSGGEKQRVSAIRAFLQKPDILLCDEPTGNLDEKNTQEFMRLLKHYHLQQHQTILMVTHDLDLARCFQRIIRMRDGYIDLDKVGDSHEKSSIL